MPAFPFLSPIAKGGLALVIGCNLLTLQKRCLENDWRFTSLASPPWSHPTQFSVFPPQWSQQVKIQTPKPPSIQAWFGAAASDRGSFPSSTFTSHLAPSTAQGGQEPAPLASSGGPGGRGAGRERRRLGGGQPAGGNNAFPLPVRLLFETLTFRGERWMVIQIHTLFQKRRDFAQACLQRQNACFPSRPLFVLDVAVTFD